MSINKIPGELSEKLPATKFSRPRTALVARPVLPVGPSQSLRTIVSNFAISMELGGRSFQARLEQQKSQLVGVPEKSKAYLELTGNFWELALASLDTRGPFIYTLLSVVLCGLGKPSFDHIVEFYSGPNLVLPMVALDSRVTLVTTDPFEAAVDSLPAIFFRTNGYPGKKADPIVSGEFFANFQQFLHSITHKIIGRLSLNKQEQAKYEYYKKIFDLVRNALPNLQHQNVKDVQYAEDIANQDTADLVLSLFSPFVKPNVIEKVVRPGGFTIVVERDWGNVPAQLKANGVNVPNLRLPNPVDTSLFTSSFERPEIAMELEALFSSTVGYSQIPLIFHVYERA